MCLHCCWDIWWWFNSVKISICPVLYIMWHFVVGNQTTLLFFSLNASLFNRIGFEDSSCKAKAVTSLILLWILRASTSTVFLVQRPPPCVALKCWDHVWRLLLRDCPFASTDHVVTQSCRNTFTVPSYSNVSESFSAKYVRRNSWHGWQNR